MHDLQTLGSMGLTLPTPAYLFGALIFGVIGFAAWRYGKKGAHVAAKWLGVALMLFPYFVTSTWLMYAIGTGLCAGLYFYRR